MTFYQKDFVPQPDALFEKLLLLPWLSETEARQEYFMSDVPRSYTYGTAPYAREYHSAPYTDEVVELQTLLNAAFGASFNICFLNRYNNQKQQLGWHADDSETMDRNHPIAVVSVGAEREIWWKVQSDKGAIPEDQKRKLEHGSVFLMPAGFQDTHFHRIPRADREVGVRISLTFRRYL